MKSRSSTLARLMTLFLGLLIASPATWGREVEMPEFTGIVKWLNTDKALSKEDLKGKVVLIDFWTYSCINCIHTLPHVTEWHKKYSDQGLVIIGVHTPEFDFEKDTNNVKAALAKYGITYPVAMDNDYATWNTYSNRYWPAHYLMDRGGKLRYQHFGEGKYEDTENKIRELLLEGSPSKNLEGKVTPKLPRILDVKTPEIYLGYERLKAIGNSERITPNHRQTFREPKNLAANRFYLSGDWRITEKFATLESSPGKISIRYEANSANMVLDSADGKELIAEVYVDGHPATIENKGTDVFLENGKALCRIHEPRLYNLTHTRKGGVHTLEVRFSHPHIRAYTFTFG